MIELDICAENISARNYIPMQKSYNFAVIVGVKTEITEQYFQKGTHPSGLF